MILLCPATLSVECSLVSRQNACFVERLWTFAFSSGLVSCSDEQTDSTDQLVGHWNDTGELWTYAFCLAQSLCSGTSEETSLDKTSVQNIAEVFAIRGFPQLCCAGIWLLVALFPLNVFMRPYDQAKMSPRWNREWFQDLAEHINSILSTSLSLLTKLGEWRSYLLNVRVDAEMVNMHETASLNGLFVKPVPDQRKEFR